jgi:adenosine deaminase
LRLESIHFARSIEGQGLTDRLLIVETLNGHLISQINKLEKGELHVHLNGVLNTEFVKKILEEENCTIPDDFDVNVDLSRTAPSTSLSEYLKPWRVLRLFPKSRDTFRILLKHAFANLLAANIKFVELRSTVLYVALLNGIDITTALKWFVEDVDEISSTFGIRAGLILTVTRGDYAETHLHGLLKAYRELGQPPSVVGLDLAGDEEIEVPNNLSKLFASAKLEFGLGITIHAGETGKVENIKQAVEEFHADRIGHGTAAGQSIESMDLLRKFDVCVEVCPISNRLTGAVRADETHPLIQFIENGVPFVICSDNPGIHACNLNDDYLEFLKESKNNIQLLNEMFDRQSKYSFLKL